MNARVKTLSAVYLLLVCLPVAAQPDILSAVPGDAYGFAATKNLQGSYDKIMAFAQAMGIPASDENQLLTIHEHLGQVDLNGPAAVILLDPEEFPEEPVALLFSAADAVAVVDSLKSETAESLPSGVVKGADGYLAVKNGLVVFAPGPKQVIAVLAGQTSLETMPAVNAAFEQGQIVLAGDVQRARPWITQKLNVAKTKMTDQMAEAPMAQMTIAADIFSWEIDLAQSLIKQTDKLMLTLDLTADRAVLTKQVLFEADSPAAEFMNSQIGQSAPTYNALPAGPFLMAAGANVATEQVQSLTRSILEQLMNLPSFKEKVSAEQVQRMIDDSVAVNSQVSGFALTANLGNPMTGMINMVARSDVLDAATQKELSRRMYESQGAAVYAGAWGMPMEYVYTSAAEAYSDVQIDTVKMQINPPAEGAEPDPMMAQQMQMMAVIYGPDMTFRVAAPTDKQMLFTVGGGSELMERAINVAQGNGSDLADQPKLKQAAASLPANRFAEAHLDIGQVMPMIMMLAMAGGGGQPGAMPPGSSMQSPPISLSCSADTHTFRTDVVVPSATIKSLVEAIGPMMFQGGMGPGGSEPPGEEF